MSSGPSCVLSCFRLLSASLQFTGRSIKWCKQLKLIDADLRITPDWLHHGCQTFLTLFYRREMNPPCSHRELRPHSADFDFLNVSPSLTPKLSLWHNLCHMTVISLFLSPSAAETPAACRIRVFSSSESRPSGSTPLEVLVDLQTSSCDLLKMWVELPASPSTV